MKLKLPFDLRLALLVLLAIAVPAKAQDTAAEITGLRGTVTAVSAAGVSRTLDRGSDLFQGDRIDTGRRSAVRMKFTDGSRFQLGANASMSVDKYTYKKDSAGDNDSFSSSIFKGVFRFVSGFIAKRRSRGMGVRTAVATIGIRGTAVAGEVDASSARIMLLEPEEDRPTAIEVSNAFGSVTIDQPGYGTEVPDANSPPSPPRRMQLRTIQNLMRTMQSIGRVRAAPRMR
jgi:hypothetical protein